MLQYILFFQIIATGVLFIFLINSLTNLKALQHLGSSPPPRHFPKISVMVPARNEEKNIKNCVGSLLNQNYPNFEVLVLNDHSTDRTGEILAQIKDPRLKVFSGTPLPEDWLGKHWACHQLAEQATGDLYLFIDADTYHRSDMLTAAVSSLQAEKADFVSALPRQRVSSWSEWLIIPIIPWSLTTFLPLFIAKRSQRPSLSATIGQFMMFTKRAYLKLGGYSAIRDQVLDDVTFGRRVKAFGLKWRIFDGNKHIACRMYTNHRELSEGMTKSIFAVFKNNLFYFLFAWLFLLWVFLGPWLILIIGLFGVSLTPYNFWLAYVAILITFLTWLISNVRFGYPLILTFLYPLIIISLGYLSYSSMVLTFAGKITWKGRPIKNF